MNFDKESKSEKILLGQGEVVESGVAGSQFLDMTHCHELFDKAV